MPDGFRVFRLIDCFFIFLHTHTLHNVCALLLTGFFQNLTCDWAPGGADTWLIVAPCSIRKASTSCSYTWLNSDWAKLSKWRFAQNEDFLLAIHLFFKDLPRCKHSPPAKYGKNKNPVDSGDVVAMDLGHWQFDSRPIDETSFCDCSSPTEYIFYLHDKFNLGITTSLKAQFCVLPIQCGRLWTGSFRPLQVIKCHSSAPVLRGPGEKVGINGRPWY